MTAHNERQAPAAFGASVRAARAGSPAALGEVLETCRYYLLSVANAELPPLVQAKVGPSDLVQQTLLEAQRDFGRFTGGTPEELRVWLRRIILNNVANVVRDYCQTQKRQAILEVHLGQYGTPAVPSRERSPGSEVALREQLAALHQALARLPEAYAQVVQWRNYERLGFEEIGRRLGRSAGAARKLWTRAIDMLQAHLDSPR